MDPSEWKATSKLWIRKDVFSDLAGGQACRFAVAGIPRTNRFVTARTNSAHLRASSSREIWRLRLQARPLKCKAPLFHSGTRSSAGNISFLPSLAHSGQVHPSKARSGISHYLSVI